MGVDGFDTVMAAGTPAGFYAQFTGQTRPVLFESEEKDGMMQGFTDNYVRVVTPFDASLINRVIACELTGVNNNDQMEIALPQLPVTA